MAFAVMRGVDLIFEYANSAYQVLVGRDRPLIGRSLAAAFPDTDLLAQEYPRYSYETGKTKTVDELAITQDWEGMGNSSLKYLTFIYDPFLDPDGKPEGVIIMAFDTTDKVLARQSMEQVTRQFETERILRERYITTLNHDIRTPLTTAKLGAELLIKVAVDRERVKLLAHKIVSSIDQTYAMVRELLESNRFKAKSIDPTTSSFTGDLAP